jgi:muramidase (phage lysozyme)
MTATATQIAAVEPLLAFIRDHEAKGDYNAIWAKIKKADRPRKPLVSMTIGEVLAWQDGIDAKYMSEAAGAYQFLEDTLRAIFHPAGLKPTTLFDRAAQDALAYHLLQGRGLHNYLAGRMSAEAFCNALAREWASLPVVTDVLRKNKDGTERLIRKGQSYYAGDGLNQSLTEAETFLAVVKGLRASIPVLDAVPGNRPDTGSSTKQPDGPRPDTGSTKPPSGGFFMRLWRALFGG